MKFITLKYNPTLIVAAAALLPHFAAQSQTIPAQRVSDFTSKAGSPEPANFTLIDNRLFFTASDKHGNRGVYLKNLLEKDFVTLYPTVWTGKGNTPVLLKNFKLPVGVTDMDQFTGTESEGLPKTGKVYFHAPGSGLWMTYGKTPLSLGKFDNPKAFDVNKVTGMISALDDLTTPLVYFGGWAKKNGQEVYRSGGTAKTTKIVDDIAPGLPSSSPDEFVELKEGETSTVFFRATGPGNVLPQIWQTQTQTEVPPKKGSAAAASIVLSSTLGTPEQLVTSNDIGGCYFVMPGANSNGVPELWSTTSTLGTEVQMTSGGVAPQHLTEFPAQLDSVLFSGSDSVNGRQIWLANSFIPAGEVLDVVNPNGDANPDNLTAAASSFYYTATAPDAADGNNPDVLLFWTDGNPGDSTPVDYQTGGLVYYPINPTEITPGLDSQGSGEWVYFVADGFVADGAGVNFHTGVLWVVDNSGPNINGTIDAQPVRDGNSNIITGAHNLKAVINPAGESFFRLYFSRDANDGLGPQVWETE